MTNVSIECPGCLAKLNLPDQNSLGKKIKCPKCAEVFVAEAADGGDDEWADDEEELSSRPVQRRKRPSDGSEKKNSKKSSEGGNKGLLIGGGIAALAFVVGGGLFLSGVFRSGNQQLQAPPDSNQAPVATVNPPTPTPPAVATPTQPAAALPIVAASSAMSPFEGRHQICCCSSGDVSAPTTRVSTSSATATSPRRSTTFGCWADAAPSVAAPQ